MDSLESLLKTIIESNRLISSGGKYSAVRSRTWSRASVVTTPLLSVAVLCAKMSLPRLLVRQIIVFYNKRKGEHFTDDLSVLILTLKSTLRPCESVKVPSSRICNKIIATSCNTFSHTRLKIAAKTYFMCFFQLIKEDDSYGSELI